MTLTDICDAIATEQAHGVRVIEVHVSPRIELEIARRAVSVDADVLTIIGGGQRPGRAVRADWYVDHALTGEQYRFVTAPTPDRPPAA